MEKVRTQERFRQELAVCRSVSGPWFPALQDAWIDADGGHLLMEEIEGQTLELRIRECGPLEEAEMLQIGIGLCEALSALHEEGILCLDVKPSNIILSDSGRIVLPDLDAARFVQPRRQSFVSEKRQLFSCGTPGYAPPELVSGRRVDVRSDVYGVGRTLRRMMIGYGGHKKRPPYTAACIAMVRRAAQERPALRYPDPAALKEEMERILHTL